MTTAAPAPVRPAFVVIDVRSGHRFESDWDGQPFDAETALDFMRDHNARVGVEVYVLIHGWTRPSRGDVIGGADWRACDHCGRPASSPVHGVAA
jgi:hypothetical protein